MLARPPTATLPFLLLGNWRSQGARALFRAGRTIIPRMKREEIAEAAWQRHPLFRFFASVKLAMLLLAVLIVAMIAGTLWESSFDARVARAYIYDAWWFYIWLAAAGGELDLLGIIANAMEAASHGFLLTHLGIIRAAGGGADRALYGGSRGA